VSVTHLTHSAVTGRSLGCVSSSRVLPHVLRAALLVVAGSVLIAGPFLLGLGAAPLVTGVLIGSLTIALGVAGTESGSRGSLPLSAQSVYDRGLALGLVASAGLFVLYGELEAAVLFAGAGLAAFLMTAVTRYSAGTA
jgi:hypothetical protein